MIKDFLKLLFVFIVGVIGGIFGNYIFPIEWQCPQCPIYQTKIEKIYIKETSVLKELVEKVENPIVKIKTETKKEKILGGGIILTADGFLITLADFFPSKGKTEIFWEGEKIKNYKIIKIDPKENLALIKIEKKEKFPTVGFANLEKLKKGEKVFLIGVFSKKESLEKFVNQGIIKYFKKELIETNITEKNGKGSFLFNFQGELIGINEIDKKGKIKVIPIDKIKKFANL